MAGQIDLQSIAWGVNSSGGPPRSLLKSRAAWLTAAALMLSIATVFYFAAGRSRPHKYLTAEVTRGPIIRAVTGTGTVNPVTTVPVGTYVSGPIIAIYADFNARVRKGELIAKIDPRPFELKAAESKAMLENTQAELSKDEADMRYKKLLYERTRGLLALGATSRNTVDNNLSGYQQTVAQVALDRAQIKQQQAAVQDAEVNLNYTNIVSPVDGTVVSRNVDVGQTVAASFQTPTLFLIANDLTQMQVDCNVSESDIGGVREGEAATFKVDAFPDRELSGTVAQVRQAPITVQNVVTYDVVLKVTNPELLLKPGMTANVTIITARRDGVVRVPIQALRFLPHRLAKSAPVERAAIDSDGRVPRYARIWIRHGPLIRPVEITSGLSDDNFVEVLSGKLRVGQKVVVDEITASTHDRQSRLPRLP